MNEHLGRGLSALIPDIEKEQNPQWGITTLPVNSIKPNHYQPRKTFDPEKLAELTDSIRENGIIQPIIVTKTSSSEYELVAGERRLEAAKQAGLEKVPVVIRSVSEKEQLQLALIENIQREDLNPIEEAIAYNTLVEDFSLTHSQISEIVGKDRATVTNSLRLLKLPEEVKQMLVSGELNSGQARTVLSVSPNLQNSFAEYIIKYNLTVRQAEEKAKTFALGKKTDPLKSKTNLRNKELEKELSKMLRLQVKVQENKGKGKITLTYKSQEELTNFIAMLNNLRREE
ncbi:MAG TPA: ParB/RepB/Spo0J family partition protein [Candidatus Cloacimonas sp.]|jgi:ParB family chromosome partitioning protein|nr:ParB/RepB/Spo0J family partition protein [Candidatus Cloacimonas sp.]HPS60980.1 ParB/RepB/Spo0J family partition protein [Candidatus Cloacimonas sp.]